MVYMRVEDYFETDKRWWVRLRQKGGKVNELPAITISEEYLDAWVSASGLGPEPTAPLFPTLRHGKFAALDEIERVVF